MSGGACDDRRRRRRHATESRDCVAHRFRNDPGGEYADFVDARIHRARRAHERDVPIEPRCDGWIARANPCCALSATSRHSDREAQAFVTTTTRVVLPNVAPGNGRVPSGAVVPASTVPSARSTSPREFTAASAATTSGPSRRIAVPIPPGAPCSVPSHFPTRALRPAPTAPRTAPPVPDSSSAAASAWRPSSGPGTSMTPGARSKSAAAGTIGTGPAVVGKPRPSSASAA